jgi:hypothetical protein
LNDSRWNRVPSGRVAVAACAALLSAGAIAGARFGQPSVVITPASDGGGTAVGTLGGVRNSAGTVERLSCAVSRTEITPLVGAVRRSTTVSCSARNQAGATATCVSTSEVYATVLDGVTNDSLIEFHYSPTGQCRGLFVYESSSLERKRP